MSTDVRTHIEYYRGTRDGWTLAVIFAVIGLVDAILGESLAIIGFDILLIPAGVWIVANIALLVILWRPERWRSARRRFSPEGWRMLIATARQPAPS